MYLMHKNDIVARFECYNYKPATVTEIFMEDKMPIGLRGDTDFATRNIMSWHSNRAIPIGRMNYEKIEDALKNFGGLDKVTFNSMGLSLNDCYWYKNENSSLTWEDVNFRDNNFSEDLFRLEVTGVIDPKKSPDYRTNGALKKFWTIQDGSPILVKSGEFDGVTNGSGILAANEVYVSILANVYLGFKAATYSRVDVDNSNEKWCASECFIKRDEDLVTARDLMNQAGIYNENVLYDLIKKELPQAMDAIDNMIMLDVLVHNTDRHPDNIGFIFDADTGNFKRVAPIFDSGNCLSFAAERFNKDNVNNMRFPTSNRSKCLDIADIFLGFGKESFINRVIPLLEQIYKEFDIPEHRLEIAKQDLLQGIDILFDREIPEIDEDIELGDE